MHTLNLLENPVLLESDFNDFIKEQNLKGLQKLNEEDLSKELYEKFHPTKKEVQEKYKPQSVINKPFEDEMQLMLKQFNVTGLGYVTKKQNICYIN